MTERPRRSRPLWAALIGLGLGLLVVLAGRAGGQSFRPADCDLAAARDPGDLAVAEVPGGARTIDGVTVREIRFTSAEWDARGARHPTRLQAFLALPPGVRRPGTTPAVVTAHGLGAHATAEGAAEITRNLDVVALAVSAPGLGGSEGHGITPADSRPLFTTVPDPRRSWLYASTYGLLRAITVVQQRPEVDPGAVVLTGASMGGIATLAAGRRCGR
jgi:dipeptidyl aminopeptidase/acylaminoacyl peptidase